MHRVNQALSRWVGASLTNCSPNSQNQVGVSDCQKPKSSKLNQSVRRMLPEIQLKFPIHIGMRRIAGPRENPLESLVDGVSPFVGQKSFEQTCTDVYKPKERCKKQTLLQICTYRHDSIFSRQLRYDGLSATLRLLGNYARLEISPQPRVTPGKSGYRTGAFSGFLLLR
jgi:hypothetical protein